MTLWTGRPGHERRSFLCVAPPGQVRTRRQRDRHSSLLKLCASFLMMQASLQAQLSCSAPAVPAPKPSAVSVSLSQDRRPHFLLVSDSNNLVSVFKVSIPSSPSSVSTSSTTAPRSKASGGASPFLLLQLPKSSCTPDHISPNGCPGSSGSGAPVYVTWVPSSPEAGPASSRQTSKVEGVTGPAFLGGGVFFLTVQSHQVVVWSLPVLRSYCVSQSIMPEKQPLTVSNIHLAMRDKKLPGVSNGSAS